LKDVVAEAYGRMAQAYERRWRRYLEETIGRTLDALAVPDGGRVLDAGCGTGLLLRRLRERSPEVEGWGIDRTVEMLRVASRGRGGGFHWSAADVTALPLADASFDAVTSSSSLHHWPDPLGALAEIARVIRPGAPLVLTDWCADVLRFRPFAAYLRRTDRSIHRIYGVREVEELLAASGFSVLRTQRYVAARVWGIMTIEARRSPVVPGVASDSDDRTSAP
jgi:ubiquinone/menaquinone biosynthesis C-methylase UbiE